MSRRVIVLVIACFVVLVIANILVVAVWWPRHKNPAPGAVTQNGSPATAPGAASLAKPTGNEATGNFAVERQVPSASGNLVVKYLRDRKTKTRQIAVQDAHAPNNSAVLFAQFTKIRRGYYQAYFELATEDPASLPETELTKILSCATGKWRLHI